MDSLRPYEREALQKHAFSPSHPQLKTHNIAPQPSYLTLLALFPGSLDDFSSSMQTLATVPRSEMAKLAGTVPSVAVSLDTIGRPFTLLSYDLYRHQKHATVE